MELNITPKTDLIVFCTIDWDGLHLAQYFRVIASSNLGRSSLKAICEEMSVSRAFSEVILREGDGLITSLMRGGCYPPEILEQLIEALKLEGLAVQRVSVEGPVESFHQSTRYRGAL